MALCVTIADLLVSNWIIMTSNGTASNFITTTSSTASVNRWIDYMKQKQRGYMWRDRKVNIKKTTDSQSVFIIAKFN